MSTEHSWGHPYITFSSQCGGELVKLSPFFRGGWRGGYEEIS